MPATGGPARARRDKEVVMTERSAQGPDPADGLHDLYLLYVQFMADFGQERGCAYPWRDYPDFAAWWRELPAAARQRWERDFRRGYAAVVAEGERRVAAALARYDSPAPQHD
jgi:hypothetical protein